LALYGEHIIHKEPRSIEMTRVHQDAYGLQIGIERVIDSGPVDRSTPVVSSC
jgi:hypothetical protein